MALASNHPENEQLHRVVKKFGIHERGVEF